MATARETALQSLRDMWYSQWQIDSAMATVRNQQAKGQTASQIKSNVQNNSSSYFWGWAMYGSWGSSSSSSSSSNGWGSTSSSSNTNANDIYGDVWGKRDWATPMDFSNASSTIDESSLSFWTNAAAKQAKNSNYLSNRNNDIASYLYALNKDKWGEVDRNAVKWYLDKFKDFTDAEEWEQNNTIDAILARYGEVKKEKEKTDTWVTWVDEWSINETWWNYPAKDWMYHDANGNYFNILWYDDLSPEQQRLVDQMPEEEKKRISNEWAKGMQDKVKYKLDREIEKQDMGDIQKMKEALHKNDMSQFKIQTEQTLRNAEEQYNNLKQNWQYLGNMWMPGTSATKIQAIGDCITEAKTQLKELNSMLDLQKEAKEMWWDMQVLQYTQQIDNINRDLVWKLWSELNWLLSQYTVAELEWKLDTIDGITAFKRELLEELDNNLSWITSESLTQMQYINQYFQDIADKAYDYAQNANTVNSEMSAIKWFYVDWNWTPILNDMGQPIQVPPTAPMEPIFDKETGKLITFAYDENWQIVANVQQLWSWGNSEAAITQYGIVSMLEQWYSIWDILKQYPNASYKDVQALSEVVKQTMDKNGRSLTWEWGNYNAVSQDQLEQWYNNFTSKYATINENGKFVLKNKDKNWLWVKAGQCGHFVNNYLQELWVSRLFTDPITEKTKNINSNEAKKWNVVIMNSPSAPQYWHVGIVTNVDADGNMTILQSNKAWEEKVFFSKKNVNDWDVLWFFDPTKSIQTYNSERQWEVSWGNDTWTLNGYKEWYTSDYTNFLKNWTKWFTKSSQEEIKKIFGSWENFVANANAYKTVIDHQVWDVAMTMVDNMIDVLSYLNSEEWSINSLRFALPWTKAYDMKGKFNQIMKSSALQKLIDLKEAWATFWALSDNELWFITDAADWFSLWSSEDWLKEWMKQKINKIMAKSWMTLEEYKARRWLKEDTTTETPEEVTSEDITQYSRWNR